MCRDPIEGNRRSQADEPHRSRQDRVQATGFSPGVQPWRGLTEDLPLHNGAEEPLFCRLDLLVPQRLRRRLRAAHEEVGAAYKAVADFEARRKGCEWGWDVLDLWATGVL